MLDPEIVNEFGETYEEMRVEVDMEMYGITDDSSVPYPWEEASVQSLHEEKPQIVEVELVAA